MEEEELSSETIRVLVVEDQQYMRTLVMQTLNRMGIRNVYEAEEGGAAFKMTVRLQPHIVFCDIHMEPIDGLQYLNKLRTFKNAEISRTPVVFLTADSQEGTVVSSKKAKVNGYIVKPTSAQALKSNINRLLGPIL